MSAEHARGKSPAPQKSAPTTANPRRMALSVLLRMQLPAMEGPADGYSNLLIDAAVKSAGPALSDADKALFCRLVAGVCERRTTLDRLIAGLSARHPAKLDADVLNILRLGLWQLRYADRIPEHAAVNETVNLAKKYSRSFVNAVLRGYLRKKDSIELPAGSGAEALSVRYSVGKELCAAYLASFGAEKTESILAASFDAPKMTLRANTLRTSREALAERLEAEGFASVPTADAPHGLKLTEGSGIPAALRDGLCYVQDEASQICAAVLDAQPGERVLDVCACPGSKSFGAAMSMQNRGEIRSCDLHASKLPLIIKEAEKLGITVIKTECRDSSAAKPEEAETYDRVICDVPCSGFGVIAKKPEIRYKNLKEARELPALQYKILEAAAAALKKGGTLVYSTCTILPEENEGNVRALLKNHPEFSCEAFAVGSRTAPDGMLTLFPDEGTDGFFIAKLRKK